MTVDIRRIQHARRRAGGAVSIPILSFVLSLVIGAGVGLLVAIPTGVPWLGIVAGFGAMFLTWIIAGAIYYRADFIRYTNIQRM